MGTDIYLHLNGKRDEHSSPNDSDTDEDERGYIRASIGMKRENALLMAVFPKKFWKRTKGSVEGFDFKAATPKLVALGIQYLDSCLTGSPFLETIVSELEEKEKQLTAALQSRLGDFGRIETTSQVDSGMNEFRFGLNWLETVLEFFDLAIEKQEQGFRPYPYISW